MKQLIVLIVAVSVIAFTVSSIGFAQKSVVPESSPYSSSVSVQIHSAAGPENGDRLIAESLEELSSATTLEVASRATGESQEDLKKALTFVMRPGTNTIEISAQHDDSAKAKLMANAVANVFIAKHPEAYRSDGTQKNFTPVKLSPLELLNHRVAKMMKEPVADVRREKAVSYFEEIYALTEGEANDALRKEGFKLMVDLLVLTPNLNEGDLETYWSELATMAAFENEQMMVIQAMEKMQYEWAESILDYFIEDGDTDRAIDRAERAKRALQSRLKRLGR